MNPQLVANSTESLFLDFEVFLSPYFMVYIFHILFILREYVLMFVDTFSFDTDKLSKNSCLAKFTPASQEEIQKIVKNSPDKFCELDPVPKWLFKLCLHELLPLVTKIINFSLETGCVPASFKSKKECKDQESINQVPHLTQGTNGKVTNLQRNTTN